MLAAGALIASLFAVGAAPAASAPVKAGDDNEAKPSNGADFTACLGPALADHGFNDLGSLEATVPNINCLAYYGITVGKTADTFDPNSNVTRGEMALFLYRAAGLMGVDLMGGDMSADFGDVDMLGEDRQNAIAALARNGILEGRGGMGNFYPHADITRAEMAVAMVALLDHTPGAPVHKNEAGLYELGDDADTAEEPNDHFTDARASVPRSVDNAISAAYELGITAGVGDGSSFDPGGFVPRRNMATFIVRAMAHSNLRPTGLTAQNNKGTIRVSVRGAAPGFAAVPNQSVDAFRAADSEVSLAFSSAGCTSRVTAIDGSDRCEIDTADPVTRTNGNTDLAALGADEIGKGVTVWVWHGDIGDKFSAGDDAFKLMVPPGASSNPAASATISDSLPDGITKARFGATVTVTVQLKDADGDDTGRGNAGGDDGVEYTVVIHKRATADGTDPTDSDTVSNTDTVKVKVADDGSATFTLDARDENRRATGNRVLVSYTVSGGDFSSEDPVGPNLDPAAAQDGSVIFSDEMSAVFGTLKVEVAPYQDAPSGTSGKAGSAATVTATDQFGKPVEDAGIILESSNEDSVVSSKPRFTGPDGRVRIGYTYVGGSSVETLTATWPGLDADSTDDDVTGTASAYWVTAWAKTDDNDGAQTALGVLNADLDANQVVVGTNAPMSVNYDSGDQFTVNDEPSSMAEFEEELGKVLAAQMKAQDTFGGTLTLAWTSYDHEDSADIASFTLAATLPS